MGGDELMGAREGSERQRDGTGLDRIQKEEAAIKNLENEYAKEEATRNTKQQDHDVTMASWGHVWNGVASAQADPATGAFQIKATDGAGAPVALTTNQVVWIFVPSPDGNSSVSLGQFKVTAAAQGTFSLVPNFRVRLADPLANRPDLAEPLKLVTDAIKPRPPAWDNVADWKRGTPVRVRTAVPTQHVSRATAQEVDLLMADERVILAGAEYTKQVQLLDAAKKLVQTRTEEITGTAALADKNIPDEYKLGLVKALQDDEESRNRVLLSVDDLRHRLKRTNDLFGEVRQRNAALEKSLPRPAAETASSR